MVTSIQTDEARHAQIGPATMTELIAKDPARAQRLVDKWFWRSWLLFAVVTGISLDYLTPVDKRRTSFREFVEEWVIDQFRRLLRDHGLKEPWYWDKFVEASGVYHHRVYATAYTYRATTWFDFALPGPAERAWLREKYPDTWDALDPIWEHVTRRWQKAGPGVEWYSHGTVPVGFCHLCQLVLCNGAMPGNDARVAEHEGKRMIFCSEPCARIFAAEPERYASHKNVVDRILEGEAPANLIALVRRYFGLSEAAWGRDVARGGYPWMRPRP
jgi:toluene monooxygenase system protein A